ncbi:MAG TPA: A24 family peptidase [Phycisphaerae bacterium]|nr:A24 family peptidase [Phycisphaerae bacterium]HPS53525.1 A24 family peptidase [Phycisphaerae bacterium]
MHIPVTLQYWPFMLAGVLLAVSAWSDYRRHVIPDAFTLPVLLIALAGHLACSFLVAKNPDNNNIFSAVGVMGFRDSLYGLLLGGVPMTFVWRAGGVGGGDVKLLAAVGATLGWRWTLDIMFVAFILSAAWAIIIIIRKNIAARIFMNIWTFLAHAHSRKEKNRSTANSPGIEFALAAAGGFIIAVVCNIANGMNGNFTMNFAM